MLKSRPANSTLFTCCLAIILTACAAGTRFLFSLLNRRMNIYRTRRGSRWHWRNRICGRQWYTRLRAITVDQ
jgi:hypothetical protein